VSTTFGAEFIAVTGCDAVRRSLIQVLFADRFTAEFPLYERPHRWQGIEPGEQLGASFRAFQQDIQFFADIVRQTGDFAIASFHNMRGVGGWPVISSFQFFNRLQ
jgi:hypothetical protein